MLFKGTKTRSTNAIAQSVQDEGGYINAYTSFDRTVYWIDVPREGVGSALDILADAMMNSTLPVEEYRKEQEVIRREFAMCCRRSRPDDGATACSRRPTSGIRIGCRSSATSRFSTSSRSEDVVEYYRARYVPNNLTFVVVGDVDAGAVYAPAREIFSTRIPRGRCRRSTSRRNRRSRAGVR